MVAANSSNELALEINGTKVTARESDRYVPATALCQAAKKRWNNYWRNEDTQAFIQALAESTRIPAESLVQMKSGRSGGTWIHPRVVVHFAQWVSPEFAVRVSGWVVELLTKGEVKLSAEDVAATRRLIGIAEDLHGIIVAERVQAAKKDAQITSLAERIVSLEGRLGASPLRLLPASSGPEWTVELRLSERYPEWCTTRQQRANIRSRTNNMVKTLYPGQEVHRFNRDCVYSGPQILLLDRSMDREYRRAQREGTVGGLGLFAEHSA